MVRSGEARFDTYPLSPGRSEEPGQWTFTGIAPGEVVLVVRDRTGALWAEQPVTLDQPVEEMRVDIPIVPVDCRLSLGGKPFPPILVFGGLGARTSVKVTTDEEGTFRCTLPRPGRWNVTVGSRTPRLNRDVGGVVVERTPGEAAAHLEIDLPDTLVEGKVVAEDGSPAANATVYTRTLSVRDAETDVMTDRTGAFLFRALAEGKTAVRAVAEEGTSKPSEITVDARHPVRGLVLVLHAPNSLKGRVVGAHGPVIGALETVLPVGPAAEGAEAETGVDGRFEAPVPEWAAEVVALVMAPGHPLLVTRLPVPQAPGAEALLALPLAGGTLHLQFPDPPNDPWLVATVFDFDGIPVSFSVLRRWLVLQGAGGAGTSVVPALAAGTYRVCAVPSAVAPVALAGAFIPHRAVCSRRFVVPRGGQVEAAVPAFPRTP